MKKQFIIGAVVLLPTFSVAIAQYQPSQPSAIAPQTITQPISYAKVPKVPHRGSGRKELAPDPVLDSLFVSSGSGANWGAIIPPDPTPFQLPVFVG